jgi:S1-C subfamily serine protease
VQQTGETRTVVVKLVPFDELIRQKLGLTLLRLSDQTAATYQINPGAALFIEKVEPRSPADKAQLERGILLTGIDGQATGDLLHVAIALSQKKPGERVSLSVVVQRQVGPGYAELRQGKVELAVR